MNSQEQQSLFEKLAPYHQLLESTVNELPNRADNPLFYEPIHYFLNIPGKRIRPILVMLCAEALGQSVQQVRYVAAAVELLHNFTLVHDDIMDQDDFRRGQQTIHAKWDISTAILAGDGLMGFAFQLLLRSPVGDVSAMARRFTAEMIVICEGQGQDKLFEQKPQISTGQYLEMIARKTAVLLQLSCELGAMSAGASSEMVQLLKRFGYALGMGFQIQDDVLDIFGDSDSLGKKVGSDWDMHKQTILTLKLIERLPNQDIYGLDLDSFRALLRSSGVLEEVQQMYRSEFIKADRVLQQLPPSPALELLSELSLFLRQRSR